MTEILWMNLKFIELLKILQLTTIQNGETALVATTSNDKQLKRLIK